jgi:hypothetical protein
LPRLLLRLIRELFTLLAPIAALTFMPPPLALGLTLLLAFAAWAAVRLGWMSLARASNWLTTAGAIGFSFSVFHHWAVGWWSVPLAAMLLLAGLALASALEKRLGLAPARAPTLDIQTVESAVKGGASAWGGGDLPTPEGGVVRTFGWSEIAMGGPTYASYLFPDGILLEGIGSSVRFSASGRYFAAPLPSRGRWGLLILDRQARRVYRHHEIGELWEIDEFSDEAIVGRHSPLVSNQGYRIELAGLLAQSEAVDLVAVRDLWLEPRWSADETARDFPAPAGSHRLRGLPHLPAHLRELEDPLALLRYPAFHLHVDDEPSGLLLDANAQPVWRADGQALVCSAIALGYEKRRPAPLYLWQAGQGWRQLAEPWRSADAEPGLSYGQPISLDETEVRLQGGMGRLSPDRLGFGYYSNATTYSEEDTRIGHDHEGRILAGECRCPGLIRILPLAGDGQRGEGAVLGEPLSGGEAPRFEWRRDSRDGRLGAYACCIGDWRIEGEWLLDHRVSDCGRYLALVAFAEAPAVPHQLCVADVQRRCLLHFAGNPIILRLLDFRAGVLSVAQALGRLANGDDDTPLRRFEQAAPPAQRAADFLAWQEDSHLYYRQFNLGVADGALVALPDWRLVDRPQVANADGDFILPAPHGRDAAWLFGAESRYRDRYLRERHPRGGGYLLTASGLAVPGLGPSLIWSADGRYLALTRCIDRLRAAKRVETDQWHLLLLDTQERTLRHISRHIGCMPHFRRFTADVIEWRILPNDWEYQDAAADWQTRRIPLDELLPQPAARLHGRGEFWLPAEELARADQWRRLDTRHLQTWRPE